MPSLNGLKTGYIFVALSENSPHTFENTLATILNFLSMLLLIYINGAARTIFWWILHYIPPIVIYCVRI